MKTVQGKHKIQESWLFHKQQKWQAEVIPMIRKAKQSSEETRGTKSQVPHWFQIQDGTHEIRNYVKLMRILMKVKANTDH